MKTLISLQNSSPLLLEYIFIFFSHWRFFLQIRPENYFYAAKTWSSSPATESPWCSAGLSSLLLPTSASSASSSAGSCLPIVQVSSTWPDKLSLCCYASSHPPSIPDKTRQSGKRENKILWQACPLHDPPSSHPHPRLNSDQPEWWVVKLCPVNFWHLWHPSNSFLPLSTAMLGNHVFLPRKRTL